MTDLTKVFPSEDQTTTNVTAEIQTSSSQTVVFVKGMQENDSINFEINVGDSCTPEWIPLRDCCDLVKINYPQNFTVLPIPLDYRGVLTNSDGSHLTDPTWFDDVSVKFMRLPKDCDMTNFYHLCCE